MTVTEYAMSFTELSRHAHALVSIVRERVCKFNEGFGYSLRFGMEWELQTRNLFHKVLETGRRLKRING